MADRSDGFRARGAFAYSRWDGTQRLDEPDAQSTLDALADDYLRHGDLRRALERLAQRGFTDRSGQRRLGLQDLLRRLRRERERELQRHDLSGVMADIAKRLERVKQLEREGIRRRLDREEGDAGEAPGELGRNLEFLDQLPPDPAGQVRQLSGYDFVDDRARKEFQELLATLQRQVMQQHFRGMEQALRSLTPEDLARLADMVRDLNRMLRQRAAGEEPDFDAFMARHGDHFPGATSLDDLVARLQRQQMAMQAVLDSMSPAERRALRDLMTEVVRDERLQGGLIDLAVNLDQLAPPDARTKFRLTGDQPLSLAEAMDVMGRLQELDRLERELAEARRSGDLDRLDPERLAELLGEEEAQALRELRSLAKRLEDEELIKRDGERLELTARGIRRIGQKALEDIFARLDKDAFGQHRLDERGHGGERADDTKPYAFGDPFHLHLERTLMHGLSRSAAGTPIRLAPEDFEVYRTEHLTQSATVVMLDMSLSMLNRDLWQPAKKVTVALESLIRGQFPRDQLYVVGFSHAAHVYTPAELIELTEWDTLRGTNMVHGLRLARELLGRSRAANKQIIMVTDGGPTVWEEGGRWLFEWPTNRPTELQTLREVRRCARDGIGINVFMLADDPDLKRFVNQMAAINKGRAFYASPDDLGAYVVIDYLSRKQKRVG